MKQRTSFRSVIGLAIISLFPLLIFIAGCQQEIKQGELKGQVFVVTQGGQNIKLALVDISAIPEEVISKFIDEKKSAVESEKKKLRQKSADFQQSADNSKRELDTLSEQTTERKKKATERIGSLLGVIATNAELSIFPTAKYYFDGLPTGVAHTITDSEGNFTLKVRDRKKYALAAKGERQVGDSKEEYYWLVWADLNGDASKAVMLSNHNLMTTQSGESLVYVQFMTVGAFYEQAAENLRKEAEK